MSTSFSLLRRLQYDELSKVNLEGKLLDIGGGKRSEYPGLLKGTHTIDVADLQNEKGVDLVFDAQKPFPIKDDAYDGVIMFNVLEHLFDYQNAVNESFRVLRPGGRIVGTTPFLFNVHGSPSDYFRYTKPALEEILKKAGFVGVSVRELGTGAFSVIYHLLYGFYRFDLIKECAMRFFTFLDRLFLRLKKTNMISSAYMPLGFFFEARKEGQPK
jgi:SAM-dependent methyltransferase